MGGDIASRQPSCFYGFMASPSWFPTHRDHHSRFHLLGHEETPAGVDAGCRSSRRWRSLLRRLLKEGKSGWCGSPKPQLRFHYDIDSYAKNFDDGCCWERGCGFCRRCEDPGVPARLKGAVSAVRPLKPSLPYHTDPEALYS